MKKLIAAIVIMIMCLAFAGCGGSSGFGEGEQFQLGDNTYALEKTVRAADKDTGSAECYGVSILQVGNTAPIIISGLGNGSMSTKSAIDLTLGEGDDAISPKSIRFEATDEVEGYGSRMVFYFEIPSGEDMPDSAFIKEADGDESVQLDLSGLTPEEETEATTAATTAAPTTAATVPPTVSADPDYDPEANKGIGDTEIYEPIESFDVSTPDTDF